MPHILAFDIEQMDVSNAYLDGEVEEENLHGGFQEGLTLPPDHKNCELRIRKGPIRFEAIRIWLFSDLLSMRIRKGGRMENNFPM